MNSKINGHKNRNSKASLMGWVERYKRQIAVGGILVCLLVVAAVVLLGRFGKGTAEKTEDIDAMLNSALEAEETAEEAQAVEVPNDLLQDAYPKINELMENYYNYMAAGDVEGVMSLVDELSEDEQSYIEALKTLIEGYQNIRCYTKRGMQENEYLVFVRYDLKFIAVDSVAPGLQGYYVRMNDTGSYYISQAAFGEELTQYLNELLEHEDVKALYVEVGAEFETAKASDEKLAEYGTKLEMLKNGGTEETASEETAGEETTGEEGETADAGETEETPEEAPSGTAASVNKETRFKESTNVRAARSTDSDRLALGYQGEKVTHVESYEDGWSKIIFKGEEGYCKTEFLE